jgi:hypothetical protein
MFCRGKPIVVRRDVPECFLVAANHSPTPRLNGLGATFRLGGLPHKGHHCERTLLRLCPIHSLNLALRYTIEFSNMKAATILALIPAAFALINNEVSSTRQLWSTS